MAEKDSVAVTAGGLEGLFRKPKTSFENKQGEEVVVNSRPSDMVYIQSCTSCKFKVKSKSAKCIIESSKDINIEFEEPIMTGTMELINSSEVTVSINPQDQLPTVSVDHCHNVHFYFYEPRAFGSIYTAQCSDVVVHLQPPYPRETTLDIPEGEYQYVSSFQAGKMVTELVIREGAGYATTVKKKERDDRRQKELMRRFEKHLFSMIKISKPGETATKAPAKAPPTKPSEAPPTKAPPKEQPQQDGAKREAVQDAPSPAVDPDDSPLAAELKAKKSGLKPTETVERHIPVVGTGSKVGKGGFNPAIEDEEEKREFFDNEQELGRKLDRTVQWMKQSKHVIIFTGAGVSTSSGIPDFRSGMNTVLATGPGVWELRAHGESATPKGRRIVPILRALPSPTHMAIVKLHQENKVAFTVSQNVDGLHRRSGLGPDQMSELHGNTNLETCQKCHHQYLRDFETREAFGVFDHRTSRLCDDPGCRGVLQDSIINFGENLPEGELKKAFDHAGKADMCIVLGSSLRVRPACQVPEVVQVNGGKVVICNLQNIPQFPSDNRTLQAYCKCDDFMAGLLQRLELEIPSFVLKRRLRISAKQTAESCDVTVTGLAVEDDTPYSFIKSVTVTHAGEQYGASKEPLVVSLPHNAHQEMYHKVTLHFHGHYGEPPIDLQYGMAGEGQVYQLEFDVAKGTWSTL